MNSIPRWGNLKHLAVLLRGIEEDLRYLMNVEHPGPSIDCDMQNITLEMHICHIMILLHGLDYASALGNSNTSVSMTRLGAFFSQTMVCNCPTVSGEKNRSPVCKETRAGTRSTMIKRPWTSRVYATSCSTNVSSGISLHQLFNSPSTCAKSLLDLSKFFC